MRSLIIDSSVGDAGRSQRASRRTRRASCSSTVCRMAAGPSLGVSLPSSRTQRRKRCRLNPNGRRLMMSARSTCRTASSRCSAKASRALSASTSLGASGLTAGKPGRPVPYTLHLPVFDRDLLPCGQVVVDQFGSRLVDAKSSGVEVSS